MRAAATDNHTALVNFILLGFSDLPLQLQWLLFGMLLCVYLATLAGNILIILLVTLDPLLQNPMYFFLRNLSFIEVCFITITVPRTLVAFIFMIPTIPFLGCAVQMFLFATMGVSECLFLGMMAYDRYLAICNPLLYRSIMTPRVCVTLVSASWLWGLLVSLGQTSFIFSWPFCGSNVINHFFCDMPAVLSLACADTFENEVSVFIACVVGGLVPLTLILFSYVNIMVTILRMTYTVTRHKAFSTCSSHILSVGLFYGSTMFMYLRTRSARSQQRDKMLSLLYSVVTPLLNPLIYSLRNAELKGALRRLVHKRILGSN
ncbi:olfactory receptor 10A4-like [Ambystoma mexicanum]|uniref:olfactory receptor 10A4-like n=1 Tax=Ambystoma mexicanum TaxID=8296 RepID=UPI0037E85F4C